MAALNIGAIACVAWIATIAVSSAYAQSLAPYTISGDAIAAPLDGKVGDAVRGRTLVRDRQIGNCLICHTAPEPDERFMGDLAPDLKGVGARLTSGQIRLRLVDQSVLNPLTIMPPYYRTANLTRVAARFRGQPALTAAQIEDIVAYLATLRE